MEEEKKTTNKKKTTKNSNNNKKKNTTPKKSTTKKKTTTKTSNSNKKAVTKTTPAKKSSTGTKQQAKKTTTKKTTTTKQQPKKTAKKVVTKTTTQNKVVKQTPKVEKTEKEVKDLQKVSPITTPIKEEKTKIEETKPIVKNKDIEEKIEKEFKNLQPVTQTRSSKQEPNKVEKTIVKEETPIKEEKTKVEASYTKEDKKVDDKFLEEIDKELEEHYKHLKQKEEKVETKPQPKEEVKEVKEEAKEEPKATSKTKVEKNKKKKRKLKVYNMFAIIIMLITIVASVVLVLNVDKLGILPTKYFAIVVGGMVFVNLLVLLLISRKFKFFRFLGILLSILLTAISVVGSTYIKETNDFLDNNFNNIEVEVSSYKVLTLADSTLTSEKDLNGKKVGYLFETIKEIEVFKTQTNSELVEYRDLYSLYEDLLNKKIESILVDDAFIGILLDDYPDIETKTKAIYTYNVETPIEETEQEETTEELKPEELVRPINIYISGSDSRSQNLNANTRSDVNMIVSINPYTHEILLTSIPRDYYVQVYGKTGLKDKLTHAGIYGLNTSAKTVGNLFDIEIDYSVKVGMNAVVEVVDLVGGIEVYSDITFNSYHMPGWVVKKGMNKMDGKKALAYARERYAYASGDRHRIKNQQQVLEAVLKKAMTNKSLLLKYDKLLASLGKFYRTDLPADVIKAFMQEQLETMPTWTFTTQTVDGKGASLPTYTAPKYKRYVMIPYEDDVRKASINIKSLTSRK